MLDGDEFVDAKQNRALNVTLLIALVWDEIREKYHRMSSPISPTMAMSDLYEFSRNSSEEYMKAFQPVDRQIGMIVFIEGTVAGMEILSKFSTFTVVHKKLVHSYVMDALETRGIPTESISKASRSRLRP